LLQKANESTDAANRYVLLKVARDVAVQAGDAELAFKAIDSVAARYDVDAYMLKGSALSEAAKSASSKEQRTAVARHSLDLIDEAVEKDDFRAAEYLGELAVDAGREAKDYAFVKKIVARNNEVEEIAKACSEIEDAVKRLKENPVDPGANLAVGKYHCFFKGDWNRGLPMLALGNDEQLKKLAVKELEEVPDADQQLLLGDGWWDLAEEQEGVPKQQLQGRAAYWYRKAAPRLTGLVKGKVEKRLAQMTTHTPTPVSKPDTPRHTETRSYRVIIYAICDDAFTLCINGRQVLSGKGRHVQKATGVVSSGDTITVQAKNRFGNKGFGCVIRAASGATIKTDSRWMAYEPKSADQWYMPQQILRVFPVSKGNSEFAPKLLNNATSIQASQIWGKGNPCYLCFRIP